MPDEQHANNNRQPATEAAANDNYQLGEDLLFGAQEIADFLAKGNKGKRRKVYHLVATSNLPVFKLGSVICARKSVLLAWIENQESRSVRQDKPSA